MKKLFTFLVVLFATTFAVQAQLPEDFEDGYAGWTITSAAASSWVHGTNTTVSSTYFNPPAHTFFMAVNDDQPGAGVNKSGTLASGDIDLTGYTNPILNFSAYFINGDYGGDEVASVQVSTDGGGSWTTVFDVPGGGAWQDLQAPLFGYAGQTIRIAFSYNDGASWNYGFCVDDVSLTDFNIPLSVKLRSLEASCTSGLVGKQSVITGSFSNEGINTITSLDISWSDGTNTYTETINDLDVASFQTGTFEHPVPVDIAAGNASFDFWISNPNGGTDADDSDNGANFSTTGITATEGRGIYVEEATGTWCTWCPRGAVWMDRMFNCFGEHFVGVAVHNNDPMELPAFDTGLTSHPDFTGFPSVLVDRDYIIDPSELEPPTISTIQTDPVALLSHFATYDELSGELVVEASATFMETVNQTGYRFNVILTEDGMSGSTSDWAQVNAYSGGTFGPMGGYEFLPSPVPANMMVYDHVGRALLAGYAGAAGSLPAEMLSGETYSFTMDTYTVPIDMELDNVHVITLLQDNNGVVVNSYITTFEQAITVGVRPEVNNTLDVKVFPNPAQDMTNIRINLASSANVAVQVFNSVGQLVASQNYGTQSGDLIYPFNTSNLSNGMYQLKIQIDNEIITKSVVVSK